MTGLIGAGAVLLVLLLIHRPFHQGNVQVDRIVRRVLLGQECQGSEPEVMALFCRRGKLNGTLGRKDNDGPITYITRFCALGQGCVIFDVDD